MYLTAMSLISVDSKDIKDKVADFALPKEVVDKAIFNFLKQIKRSCVIASPEVVTPERFGPVTNKEIHHHICRTSDIDDLQALLLIDSHNVFIIDPSVDVGRTLRTLQECMDSGNFEISVLAMKYSTERHIPRQPAAQY